MADVAGLEVKFSVSGLNVPVGVETLVRLTDCLPDCKENQAVFDELAKSASFRVREEVAKKRFIGKETVLRLALDPVADVVKSLLCSDSEGAAGVLSFEVLAEIFARDASFAEAIAEYPHRYGKAKKDKLLHLLLTSDNPVVRMRLAESGFGSKKVLQQLAKDQDYDVAVAAQNAMEYL